MFDNNLWFVNRYKFVELNRIQPLTLNAAIDYDFKKEKSREEAKKRNTSGTLALPEPWSPLRFDFNLYLSDWRVDIDGQYNTYNRNMTQLRLNFYPPTILSTQFVYSYLIEKSISVSSDGGFISSPILTRTLNFSNNLLTFLSLNGRYGIKTLYNKNPSQQYEINVGSTYIAPSNCWGLRMSWEKTFGSTDWAGTYYLGLVVKFFNYPREFGNIGSRFNS